MKKMVGFIILLFAVLSMLPCISAIKFEVNPEYNLGETMIIPVSANFTSPLTKSNVFFYEGHSRIPMQYGVVQAGNDYYIYVLLSGKSEGNYSISLENIRYLSGTTLIEEDIFRNFSISNKTSDFYISPGAVSASGSFSFDIHNLKNSALSISVKTSEGKSNERPIFILPSNSTTASFSIAANQVKKIDFQPGIGNKTLRLIEIKSADSSNTTSYKVPAYVWGIISPREEITFFIEPSSISYSFYTNSQERKEIYLYNTGTSALKNVALKMDNELSPFLNLSKTFISSVPANSKIAIGMIFFSSSEKNLVGNIEAKAGNITAYSSLSIGFVNLNSILLVNETIINETSNETANPDLNSSVNITSNSTTNATSNVTSNVASNNTIKVNATSNITSNITKVNNSQVIPNKTQIQSVSKTCTELKGEICSSSQTCSQEPVYAKDNLCCLAECQEIKKSNSGIFIGAGIVLIILIVILWFFAKFKKTKSSPVNLLNVARGKR
jgi:hypothetical protein